MPDIGNIGSLSEFLRGQPPGRRRAMALDLGEKTIGMALSDEGLRVASPYATIRRTKFAKDVEELRRVLVKEGVGGLVIGLPVNMDGSMGPRCQSVKAFGHNLDRALGPGQTIPFIYFDERMSTQAVERTMIEADLSRARRAEIVDKLAAAYFLQAALDSLG